MKQLFATLSCDILGSPHWARPQGVVNKARKKISWFWSSGGSILTLIKKIAGRKL